MIVSKMYRNGFKHGAIFGIYVKFEVFFCDQFHFFLDFFLVPLSDLRWRNWRISELKVKVWLVFC